MNLQQFLVKYTTCQSQSGVSQKSVWAKFEENIRKDHYMFLPNFAKRDFCDTFAYKNITEPISCR